MMKTIREVLLGLLRVALFGAAFDRSLLALLDDNGWRRLYQVSKAQGVAAIVFDGLRIVMERVNDSSLGMPRQLKMRWLSAVDSAEGKYAHQCNVAQEIARICTDNALPAVIFKGLSLSRLYPEPSHRQCGDIDIYAYNGRGKELDRAIVAAGGVLKHTSPKHSELILDGVMIEGHRYFVYRYFSRRAKWLNARLVGYAAGGKAFFEGKELYGSNKKFDALFVLYHAAGHFMSEGISLRHVIDWCFVVQNAGGEVDEVAQIGLDNFSAVLCRIGKEHLGFDFAPSLCLCDDEHYHRVLADILSSDVGKAHGEKVGLWQLLKRKYRRFASRRWVYTIVGDSFFMGVLNSLWAHIVQPASFSRGTK